jgi:hypothetical protein
MVEMHKYDKIKDAKKVIDELLSSLLGQIDNEHNYRETYQNALKKLMEIEFNELHRS